MNALLHFFGFSPIFIVSFPLLFALLSFGWGGEEVQVGNTSMLVTGDSDSCINCV